MYKVLIFCFISSTFTYALSYAPSGTAFAQTAPQEKAPKKEPSETTHTKPKEAVENSIDLDAFFKKGEENAKTSSCDKPAKPADPIA